MDPSGRFLIAGCEGAQVMLWNLQTGSLVKTVAAVGESSITQVKFIESKKLALVAADCSGHAYLLHFSKMFFSWSFEK